MNTFSVAVTILVLLGVALAILLFERKRARQIEHDLRDMANKRAKGTDRPTPE